MKRPGLIDAAIAAMTRLGLDEMRVPVGSSEPGSAGQRSRHRVAMDKRAAKKARAIRRARGQR